MPKYFSAPCLPELNHSQMYAVKSVLQKPISWISWYWKDYNFCFDHGLSSRQGNVQILVCTPSNTAIDQHREDTCHWFEGRASDMASMSVYDYKSQDGTTDLDDMKSQYAGTQSGMTVLDGALFRRGGPIPFAHFVRLCELEYVGLIRRS